MSARSQGPRPLAALLALLALAALGGTPATSATSAAPAAQRLVSADGAVTEIVYALGAGGRLVGVDSTSKYPPETARLPGIGYQRALSTEGILSLAPDLLLATDAAGPPEALAQIRGAGVAVRQVPDVPTVDGLAEKIRAVAEALGLGPAGETLIAEVRAGLDRVSAGVRSARDGDAGPPRVLFLLHLGSGADLCGGRDTVADTVVGLAGGENVLHERVSGYKPVNAEAALEAAPDAILTTRTNLTSLGGVDGVLARAALAATPAGQARRVLAMDGPLLLGFGSRLPEAVAELARLLGTLKAPAVAPGSAAVDRPGRARPPGPWPRPSAWSGGGGASAPACGPWAHWRSRWPWHRSRWARSRFRCTTPSAPWQPWPDSRPGRCRPSTWRSSSPSGSRARSSDSWSGPRSGCPGRPSRDSFATRWRTRA